MREFLSMTGEPEPKSATEARDEEARRWKMEDMILRGQKGRHEELMEYVGTFDFPLLKKKFVSIALRCGAKKEDINFVDEKGIALKFDRGGIYRHYTNIIELENPEYLPAVEALFGSKRLYYANIWAHEETHAVGANLSVGKIRIINNPPYASFHSMPQYTQSGYYHRRHDPFNTEPEIRGGYFLENYGSLFLDLNEGITEKLSREVFLEYLKDSDFSDKEIEVYKKNLLERADKFSYSLQVRMVEGIINKISKYTGQPELVVWQGLVRGYFEGDTLEDEDVRQLFSETLGENFLEELSKIDTTKKGHEKLLRELMQKYGL